MRIVAAMVYDSLLIVGCMIALGFAAFALNGAQPIRSGWKLHLLQAAMLILWGGFYAYFCSRQGQTLGMRAWKLVLGGRDGHVPSFARVLWRWAVAVMIFVLPFALLWTAGLISLQQPAAMYTALFAPIALAYGSAYFLPQRRSLIDILSRTHILRVEQNPYPKVKRSKKHVS